MVLKPTKTGLEHSLHAAISDKEYGYAMEAWQQPARRKGKPQRRIQRKAVDENRRKKKMMDDTVSLRLFSVHTSETFNPFTVETPSM